MTRRALIAEVAERADVPRHVARKVLEAFEETAAWELLDGVTGVVPLGPRLGVLKNLDFDAGKVKVHFMASRSFRRSARGS